MHFVGLLWEPKVVLGSSIPLLGGQPKPAYGFRLVLGDTFTIDVHQYVVGFGTSKMPGVELISLNYSFQTINQSRGQWSKPEGASPGRLDR